MAGVGAEGEHRAASPVGRLMQRSLQRLVDGQRIALRQREVLQREQAACGVEDVGVLAGPAGDIEAAGAGDELVVAGISCDGGLP